MTRKMEKYANCLYFGVYFKRKFRAFGQILVAIFVGKERFS